MSPYQAFLEVKKVEHVTGKDEQGNDLLLTRAYTHRYDKDVNSGEIGPDHNDEGSTLFIGHINADAVVEQLKTMVLPEWNIIVSEALPTE